MAMMRLLAREDIGLAVLPPIVVKDEIAAGVLVEGEPLPGIVETFYAVTMARRFPNPLRAPALDSALNRAGSRPYLPPCRARPSATSSSCWETS
jgi:DNA-binding transcriptional LysR family regulator